MTCNRSLLFDLLLELYLQTLLPYAGFNELQFRITAVILNLVIINGFHLYKDRLKSCSS